MKNTDFENFLEKKFIKQDDQQFPKDDMSDSFVKWLNQLDPQEFIDYSDEYANQRSIAFLGELWDEVGKFNRETAIEDGATKDQASHYLNGICEAKIQISKKIKQIKDHIPDAGKMTENNCK